MIEWAGQRFSGPGGLFVVGMLAGAFVMLFLQGITLAWLTAKEAKRSRKTTS